MLRPAERRKDRTGRAQVCSRVGAIPQIFCIPTGLCRLGASMLAYLRLTVGEDPLAEVKDGERARNASRSADGDDGKVPIE